MPKLKTRKSAAKRFKITARGKLKRHKAGKSHLLTGKSRKRKRQLCQSKLANKVDKVNIRKMLPYG